MSAFRSSITSCSLFVVLWTSMASVRAQVDVRVGDSPSKAVVHPSRIEAAIYLELYGHPDTARRHIEVRVRRDQVELVGTVAADSERLTAQRIAAGAAPDLTLVDRMEVRAGGLIPGTEFAGDGSPAELKRRFMDVLAKKFPAEVLLELTMTVYRVDLPGSGATVAPPSKQRSRDTAAWVLVLEGLVPSARDQLAMSELLLFESPGAAAVINRTFVADEYVPEYKPKVRVRVPFVDVEVDVDDERGVDVHVGPMVVRTGGGYRAADGPNLLDEYLAAIRADADLQNAPLHAHVLGGVLTIEGTLNVADKLRAVALAIELSGVRGVVDRTETVASQPPYYRESDLGAYLDHRLGEHAGARKVELIPGANNRLKLLATVPTDFHAALALTVIASDPAVSELPVEPAFRDATSGAVLTLRR